MGLSINIEALGQNIGRPGMSLNPMAPWDALHTPAQTLAALGGQRKPPSPKKELTLHFMLPESVIMCGTPSTSALAADSYAVSLIPDASVVPLPIELNIWRLAT